MLHLKSSFGTRGLQKLGEFDPLQCLPENTSFIIGNAPNVKHLYRREPCINHINFTTIEHGKQTLQFFGTETPKYGPMKVKFGTMEVTFGLICCAKFHINPSNKLPGGAINLKITI